MTTADQKKSAEDAVQIQGTIFRLRAASPSKLLSQWFRSLLRTREKTQRPNSTCQPLSLRARVPRIDPCLLLLSQRAPIHRLRFESRINSQKVVEMVVR